MLKITWFVLSFVQKVILSFFKFDARAHVRVVTRTRTWIVGMLNHDMKFMCTGFGQFMMNSYEDMNDKVKSQNGV